MGYDRTFDAADDLVRLRDFLAAHDQQALHDLDRHLARPRYRPALTRIAERDGTVIGCALLAHRRLRLGAATLEFGEIARIVATADGAGLADLLGDCLGALHAEGLPLAIVRGDIAVYGPFGFAPYTFSAAAELEIGGLDAADGTLRPASEADLDDLAALYSTSYRDQPLAEVRAMPDWRAWLAEGYTALAQEDGRRRVAGYARVLTPPDPLANAGEIESTDSLLIAEAAAADAGAARALIAALAAHARARGLHKLTLRLAPTHIVARTALHLGGAARITAAPADAGHTALAGVIDLLVMLEALVPELERRLAASRYAGWSGNLRIEIETERITLALEAGRAAVIDGSRPADVRLRQVMLPALAQLCLGYRAAADLRATGGLACDDSALGLIDALFPTGDFGVYS